MRNPPAGGALGGGVGAATGAGATATGGGGTKRNFSASNWLAAAVPSALQTGQFTVNGIRPPTGSTSKANFWPH
jgi:hypothetical protein